MDSRTSPAYKEVVGIVEAIERLCSDNSGCPVGRLTYMAEHALSSVLTAESAGTAMDVCYDVQSLLSGAHALAEADGSLAEAALLQIALAKLDAYIEGLDKPGVRKNPDYTPNPPGAATTDDEYMAGMHLARELLTESKRRGEFPGFVGGSDSKRWYRGGTALDAFAKPYLERMIADQSVLDGFAAGLSCILFTGVNLPVEDLDLPVAEYRAGAQGADGTEVGDKDAAWAFAPAAKKPKKAAAKRKAVAEAV